MTKRPPFRSPRGRGTQQTGGRDEGSSFDSPIRTSPTQPPHLAAFHAINQRCLELLIDAAQQNAAGGFPLVRELRDLFGGLNPEIQTRAARCPVLLADMHFANAEWWCVATEQPARAMPLAASQGAFAKSGGVILARATLLLAWHTAHAAPHQASLLGMTADVADIIGRLPITEIERVAEKRFRHARPRWEDRPAVWRRLLLSAQSGSLLRAREFSLYSLQLLTADVISPLGRSSRAS